MPTATGADRSLGTPRAASGSSMRVRDRRLGEEADGQVGDGDADLGPRQLGGQAAERLQDPGGARVALGRGLLDPAAVDGDEGELGGDEDATGDDQQE